MTETELVELREKVKKMALSKGHPEHVAEEIAQDAALKYWRVPKDGVNINTFFAYAGAIHNGMDNALNYKGENVRPILESELETDEGFNPVFDNLEADPLNEQMMDIPKILKAVTRLTEAEAVVFLLDYCFGWNGNDIARAMGFSTERASQLRKASKAKIDILLKRNSLPKETKLTKHGTISMYNTYGCRCRLCKDAQAANARAYRKKCKAKGIKYNERGVKLGRVYTHTHGTVSSYKKKGCRCELCKKAHSVAKYKQKWRKRLIDQNEKRIF